MILEIDNLKEVRLISSAFETFKQRFVTTFCLVLCYVLCCFGQGSYGKITSHPADFIRYGLTPVSLF